MIAELYSKPILLFGCGNTLFGDDGFGPAVIEALERQGGLPEEVAALDVGTSVRDFLFDLLLSPQKPRRIYVLDAADQPGRNPGELFSLPLDQVAPQKLNDFSLHQFPSVNMLQELKDLGGVEVKILAVQVKNIPEEVRPGLSPEVQAAVPRACDWLTQELGTCP